MFAMLGAELGVRGRKQLSSALLAIVEPPYRDAKPQPQCKIPEQDKCCLCATQLKGAVAASCTLIRARLLQS